MVKAIWKGKIVDTDKLPESYKKWFLEEREALRKHMSNCTNILDMNPQTMPCIIFQKDRYSLKETKDYYEIWIKGREE